MSVIVVVSTVTDVEEYALLLKLGSDIVHHHPVTMVTWLLRGVTLCCTDAFEV